MGFPGKLKFPIISNHFAKCVHKGELSAVFSAIDYLKSYATIMIKVITDTITKTMCQHRMDCAEHY